MLAKDLLHLKNKAEAEKWVHRFIDWMERYQTFLNQVTIDENGQRRSTHERLVKARNSLIRLIGDGTLFTYLDEELLRTIEKIPSTNNQIGGGVNARLRAMLRDHRGLNMSYRTKRVGKKPRNASRIKRCGVFIFFETR